MLDTTLLPLHNDRVTLRPLRDGDAGAFAEGAADPEVRRYGHLPDAEYTIASVRAMIERDAGPGLARGDLAVLAIADVVSDVFIGSLVIFDVRNRRAEVGFWVHPAYRGSGVSTAALDVAVSFARRSGLDELAARTLPKNTGSQRVLVSAGFVYQGDGHEAAPSGQRVTLLHFACSLGVLSSTPTCTS